MMSRLPLSSDFLSLGAAFWFKEVLGSVPFSVERTVAKVIVSGQNGHYYLRINVNIFVDDIIY